MFKQGRKLRCYLKLVLKQHSYAAAGAIDFYNSSDAGCQTTRHPSVDIWALLRQNFAGRYFVNLIGKSGTLVFRLRLYARIPK